MIGCIIYTEIIKLDDAKVENNNFLQKFPNTIKASRLVAGVGQRASIGGFLLPQFFVKSANWRN